MVGDIGAGHFASRRHMATRWDEANVRPQCYGCNVMQAGRQWEFGRRLDFEEPGRAAEIMERAASRSPNSANALRAAIDHYTEQLHKEEKEKRLTWTRSVK